ncbi:unnamed protein product, partial [Rotaria sp. Silwood1]
MVPLSGAHGVVLGPRIG